MAGDDSDHQPGTQGAGAPVVRDVVVVGASAGGVEALSRFVRGLPADLAATVLVVLHIPASGPSALPAILARRGPLPARSASEHEPLLPGQILVAPPDHHLHVEEGRATLTRGPRENGHRPSIDVLFRTAAWHLRGRVIAVVLSGSDHDGTAGSLAVRDRGGAVLVQSAQDALYPVMPASVARRVGARHEASAEQLGAVVGSLVGTTAEERPQASRPADQALAREVAMSENDPDAVLGDPVGEPSGYVCPDCSGALFTTGQEPILRFRCRIGHAWTADGLVEQQNVTVETALWTAVRTLHEKADLSARLAHRAKDDGRHVSAHQFHEAAREARESAGVLKDLLESAAALHNHTSVEEHVSEGAAS